VGLTAIPLAYPAQLGVVAVAQELDRAVGGAAVDDDVLVLELEGRDAVETGLEVRPRIEDRRDNRQQQRPPQPACF
jgi:hypothetical protein